MGMEGRMTILLFINIIWASCVIFIFNFSVGEGIGVSWGRQTSQKLLPSAVVDMLLANGMDKVKFFSLNHAVLSAFSGSKISITVTIPNVEWQLINSQDKATAWVRENITDYAHFNNVDITHILVGSEPYTKITIDKSRKFVPDDFNQTYYVDTILPALGYIEEALNKAHSNIKATVSFYTDILKPDIKKPSEGDFRDDVKDRVLKVLERINRTGAPFNVNIYPLNIIREKNLPLEFAFFEEDKQFTIEDGNDTYTNVFDATFDTFVWAKRKYGYDSVPIVVGQIGWPTDGDIYANVSTATRFYQGFFKKIDGNVGTPLQRGPLDLYIYELVDENSKQTLVRGPSERHYGIYNYDGLPKFTVEFNGAGGQRKQLEPAQGVSYMPRRWCIFNSELNIDPEKAKELMNSTCSKADCSSLAYGSSCHGLDMKRNLSYAFNMYFQNRNQDVLGDACNFMGYGIVVNYDPSPNEKCKFPLQILSTIFTGGQGEMGKVLPDANTGETLPALPLTRFTILVQLFIFLLFGFFSKSESTLKFVRTKYFL
ncbi:hypothetical protein LguiA_009995 [Lonicera macranthoides]